ncbi:MAG TPA: endonuclease III [Oligoflexia bacterium]|nr:endonuclease III [Oligoflexia bacterium]
MDISAKKLLLRRLRAAYPSPQSELNFSNDYQLVVSVMLSAQTTDKKVNEITPLLFARYPSFTELSRARTAHIEQIIRPINYYRTKAKHLREMARIVQNHYLGHLPRTYNELLALPGVGNKTAKVVLCELGCAAAFPVDTHVFRVSRRLGLAVGNSPQKVEQELCQEFAPRHWRALHHWLILHGRRVCQARKPLCQECFIAEICPARRQFLRS